MGTSILWILISKAIDLLPITVPLENTVTLLLKNCGTFAVVKIVAGLESCPDRFGTDYLKHRIHLIFTRESRTIVDTSNIKKYLQKSHYSSIYGPK